MKTISIFFLLLVSVNFLSCSSSKSTGGVPINAVAMSDMKFVPETITVSKGTTVTWHNVDNKSHTATANDGLWDTGDMPVGATKSITFDSAGTFKYHCKYHTVLGVGMTGTVIVE